MREIKFRAWDEKNKKYATYFDDVYLSDEGDSFTLQEGNYSAYFKRENYIIEQYTGLKDKDGKEIYEGDIDSEERIIVFRTDLTYDSGGALHSGFYFKKSSECENELSHFEGMGDIKIIGNIHENPELLKEK